MVTLGLFVCMKTLECVLLCLFLPYLMFFINYISITERETINKEYFPTEFDNYLVVHGSPST